MIIRFHEEARDEWHAAVLDYEAQREHLGVEFVAEIREAIRAISETPERWPEHNNCTRAYRLNRFPYRVVYAIEHGEVAILTVMHTKRDDAYWQHRRRTRKE